MSDEMKGKSGKVKVMYVRSDDASSERGRNPRTGKGGGRPDKPSRGQGKGPRKDTDGKASRERSPWRTVSRAPGETEQPEVDHGGISGKSFIDPEVLRRQRAEETRVYGVNACLALFQNRPEAIVRGWFVQSVTPRFKEALRWMAANRKAYHVVDDEELTKASGTEHHGGVCFLIKKRRGIEVDTWVSQAGETDCVLALEDVSNPHNLGGIVRSCAHFGVNGVLVNDAGLLESGAAVRTAEGGAEHVSAITSSSVEEALRQFRAAGYTIVGTSGKGGTPLFSAELPKKVVLLIGREGSDEKHEALLNSDLHVSIDGIGSASSLNVSVASGIILAEWWRQNH
ncbi:tRNA/rRNA methyltransferase [Mangrovibacter phragmitis]|uniref:tRNA/rRNA methyltransferase n=1 Tax=Mangrovibacter phragmitis TaxID=1691903 RepID=A0A1B7L6M2_9ENTR|nr:tRNA/rRNA methyltransferase [Mangrovibacter phragmitis]OAT78007.1 tRNA/rRNA methyltransferase [Mangrovibacter phragmitis]